MTAEPSRFSKIDILYSFFGALFVGMTFVLKGLVLDASNIMTTAHITAIIIVTMLLITVQIYYVGYTNVRNKKDRSFFQFWLKRFVAIYIISLLTSTLLIYLYGIDMLLGNAEATFRAIIAISLPCSLGATLSELLKKIKV